MNDQETTLFEKAQDLILRAPKGLKESDRISNEDIEELRGHTFEVTPITSNLRKPKDTLALLSSFIDYDHRNPSLHYCYYRDGRLQVSNGRLLVTAPFEYAQETPPLTEGEVIAIAAQKEVFARLDPGFSNYLEPREIEETFDLTPEMVGRIRALKVVRARCFSKKLDPEFRPFLAHFEVLGGVCFNPLYLADGIETLIRFDKSPITLAFSSMELGFHCVQFIQKGEVRGALTSLTQKEEGQGQKSLPRVFFGHIAEPTTEHSARTHAKCSPSKLGNLEICPSYVPIEKGEVHPVTLSGTRCHEALETNDYSLLDEDETLLVQMCVSYSNWVIAQRPGVTYECHEEIHLTTHEPDCAGFTDRVFLWEDNTADMIDWKFGYGAVAAPEVNAQACAYVVGLFQSREKLQKVTFHFVAPRQDKIETHTFDRSDLPLLESRVSLVVGLVNEKAGKEFHYQESNCLYCDRKLTCPVFAEKLLPLAVARQELPTPSEPINPKLVHDPQIMSQLLQVVPLLESYASAVKSAALDLRLESGQEIPGFDLLERRGKLTVDNPVLAFRELEGELESVSPEDSSLAIERFLSCCSVSAPKLAKLIAEDAPKGQKAHKDSQVRETLLSAGIAHQSTAFPYLKRNKNLPALTAGSTK